MAKSADTEPVMPPVKPGDVLVMTNGAGQVIDTRREPHPNDALRAPFPAEKIGKLPRYNGPRNTPKAEREKGTCEVCGKYHETQSIHLDYVGHADVTDRLLDVDPEWNWDALATDTDGLPLVVTRGSNSQLWITLTVNGVTRKGVGIVPTEKPDLEKELISDALRNAAMRFGVALDLWSKAGDDEERDAPSAPAVVDRPCPGCGHQVQDNRQAHKADSKKPAWRCTNRACTAGNNGRPWATWESSTVLDTWPEARMNQRHVWAIKARLLQDAGGDKDAAAAAWVGLMEKFSLDPDELPPLLMAEDLDHEAREWFAVGPGTPATITNETTGDSVTVPPDSSVVETPGSEAVEHATAGDAEADDPEPLTYAEDDPARPF